jgi:hypothetical protein
MIAAVAVLALGAGAAVAATQLVSSTVTSVCVNDTNGLLRAASSCREGEHAASIGGGGNVQATQHGTFTVAWGQTDAGTVLPLTGVKITARCDVTPPELGDIGLARILLESASGTTMDAFASRSGGAARTSVLLPPVATGGTFSWGGTVSSTEGPLHAVVTSNGATATITFGGDVDVNARACVYLWHAIESPN